MAPALKIVWNVKKKKNYQMISSPQAGVFLGDPAPLIQRLWIECD